jgi:putative transcriptional regulator
MAIIVNLGLEMARRRVSVTDLAETIGITPANLSVLKNGRARAIRLTTLDALCRALDCQPGDLLTYDSETPDESVSPQGKVG